MKSSVTEHTGGGDSFLANSAFFFLINSIREATSGGIDVGRLEILSILAIGIPLEDKGNSTDFKIIFFWTMGSETVTVGMVVREAWDVEGSDE